MEAITATEKDLGLHEASQTYQDVEPRPRLWTTKEYYRAAELGLFHPEERLELIRGEILQMSPQLRPHVSGVYYSGHTLEKMTDGRTRHVRTQAPITLQNNTEPEPDVVVVQGSPEAFEQNDCTSKDILLLVEVSVSTLSFDRNRKAKIYAEDGIADYWVLNVLARQLEVRRDAANGVYQTKVIYGETESVAPLFAPQTPVLVSDLLPRVAVP